MTLREKIEEILEPFECLSEPREEEGVGIVVTDIRYEIVDQILKEIKKEIMKAIPKEINSDKQPDIIKKIPTTQGQIVGYNLALEKVKNNLKKLFKEKK